MQPQRVRVGEGQAALAALEGLARVLPGVPGQLCARPRRVAAPVAREAPPAPAVLAPGAATVSLLPALPLARARRYRRATRLGDGLRVARAAGGQGGGGAREVAADVDLSLVFAAERGSADYISGRLIIQRLR